MFSLYNGRKSSATVIKALIEDIKRLAKHFDAELINVDRDHKGFYREVTCPTTKHTYLFKFMVTGSVEIKAQGAEKTVYQEVGVLLYLDNQLNSLQGYKPSSKLFVGKDQDESDANVQNTLDFLASDSQWNKTCLNTARQIASKITNYKQCLY